MASLGLFVLGNRRSGTTLLSTLLAQHPEVAVLVDSGVLLEMNRAWTPTPQRLGRKAFGRYLYRPASFAAAERSRLPGADDLVSVAGLDSFYERLVLRFRPRASGGWMTPYAARLDFTPLLERARAKELTVRELVATVVEQLLRADERSRALIGEKTPEHLYLAPWILNHYPLAKVIVVTREPLTNVASLLRHRDARKLREAVALYLSAYSDRLDPLYANERVAVVRYEDLIADPASSMKQLWQYLGVSYRVTAPEFEGQAQPTVRSNYVGTVINPERNEQARVLLDDRDTEYVRRTCLAVYERLYPELR